MKKKYIEPRVKVYSVSAGRMVCTSELSINGQQDSDNQKYGAWGKEDNEDFGW